MYMIYKQKFTTLSKYYIQIFIRLIIRMGQDNLYIEFIKYKETNYRYNVFLTLLESRMVETYFSDIVVIPFVGNHLRAQMLFSIVITDNNIVEGAEKMA